MPTCVGLGYGHLAFNTSEAFLGSAASASSPACRQTPHQVSELTRRRICLSSPPTPLNRDNQRPDGLAPCVTPLAPTRWYRNINLLPIDYASRPRLRSRLTLGGRTFPRNPWAFGGKDSHLSYRYLRQHSLFPGLQCSLRYTFCDRGMLPYPQHAQGMLSRGFGAMLEPRYIFGASPLDQ